MKTNNIQFYRKKKTYEIRKSFFFFNFYYQYTVFSVIKHKQQRPDMEINIKYFLQIQNIVLLIILFLMPGENKSVYFYNLNIYNYYRLKQLHNDNEIIIRNLTF